MIKRNVEFEVGGVTRGVERYRNEINKDVSKFADTGRSAFADSDVGSKLVDQCMKPLVAGFQEIQEEASMGFTTKGHSAVWWTPILCLSAEKLAAVTLRTVLAGLQPSVAHARLWTACALKIGANVKQEREFDLWKDRQYQKAREEGTINLYKMMVRRVKKIDTKAARRFMRMEADLDRLDWTKEVRLHVGMKCLDTLVRHGNGWFEMRLTGKGYGRTRQVQKTIQLTDVVRKAIEEDHLRCELNRPFLLPMLCEPAAWVWREQRSKWSTESLREGVERPASTPKVGTFGEKLQEKLEAQERRDG
jgi:DNA-directed RNA polymerase